MVNYSVKRHSSKTLRTMFAQTCKKAFDQPVPQNQLTLKGFIICLKTKKVRFIPSPPTEEKKDQREEVNILKQTSKRREKKFLKGKSYCSSSVQRCKTRSKVLSTQVKNFLTFFSFFFDQ